MPAQAISVIAATRRRRRLCKTRFVNRSHRSQCGVNLTIAARRQREKPELQFYAQLFICVRLAQSHRLIACENRTTRKATAHCPSRPALTAPSEKVDLRSGVLETFYGGRPVILARGCFSVLHQRK